VGAATNAFEFSLSLIIPSQFDTIAAVRPRRLHSITKVKYVQNNILLGA
jgi:hypothetical protein